MKKLLLATFFSLIFASGATAQDASEILPGVMSQVVLSEQLIALGIERNDPILLLAATRLRGEFTNEALSLPKTLTAEDALAAALDKAVGSDSAMAGVVEDARANKSKRAGTTCYNSNAGYQVCYSN